LGIKKALKADAAILLVLGVLAASATLAYAGSNGDAIQMSAQNESHESGAADITQVNDGIKIFVHIEQGVPPACSRCKLRAATAITFATRPSSG
jgi:hypothetical protein